MRRLKFETYEDFACDIADKFDLVRELDKYNDVSIIAKYEEARRIIKELLCIGYDLHSIDIHGEEWDGYDAEYVISLCNIEGENEIWCEPILRESGYITEQAPIIYVLDNCSSKVIPHCKGEIMYEVSVGEEEYDCGCDCNECCECDGYCDCDDDEDDDDEDYDCKNKFAIENDEGMHGFCVNRSNENGYSSYSFYSDNMELVEYMARLFR